MCVFNFGESWKKYLSLVEFAYNNSYHSSIRMAPYEALYKRKCRSPVCWKEVGERALAETELVEVTNQAMPLIRVRLKTTAKRLKSYADLHRREVVFQERDMVLLKASPMTGVI